MKKVLIATLITAASSTTFAAGIGIPADSATMKSDVPAICAISIESVDSQLDLGKGKAEVTFAAMNNISPLATINVQGFTELELMAHLEGSYDKSGGKRYQVEAARQIHVGGTATQKNSAEPKKLNTNLRELVKDGGSNYKVASTGELHFVLEAKEGNIWKAGKDLETTLIATIDCE